MQYKDYKKRLLIGIHNKLTLWMNIVAYILCCMWSGHSLC